MSKALGKKPPVCVIGNESYTDENHEIESEGDESSCCSCNEYHCVTRKESHYRQALLEAAIILDDERESLRNLAKQLRISAGEEK